MASTTTSYTTSAWALRNSTTSAHHRTEFRSSAPYSLGFTAPVDVTNVFSKSAAASLAASGNGGDGHAEAPQHASSVANGYALMRPSAILLGHVLLDVPSCTAIRSKSLSDHDGGIASNTHSSTGNSAFSACTASKNSP
jgi:hypothetical protein